MAGCPILSQKLAVDFQLLRKSGIRHTTLLHFRHTRQVSGHDLAVSAKRAPRARAAESCRKTLQKTVPCAAGSRAAAPASPVLACSGVAQRSANKNSVLQTDIRHDKHPQGCFPAASFALRSLNPSSSRIRSNAPSSSAFGFVIPFSRAFFSSSSAGFFWPSSASAVATR